MRLPTIHGRIDRRMLVNYRVDPDVLAAQLPAPFRPKLFTVATAMPTEWRASA